MPAGPPAPAFLAVLSASATSRAAPRALLVDPLRNREATITGAESGLDTVAISAFSPFTPL